MIRRPIVRDRKGKSLLETGTKTYTRQEKRTIAFQSTVSVPGSAVSTQDCSVETENSWVPIVTCEAAVQTPFESCAELYTKLLQKSDKVVSLERNLNQTLRDLSASEAFSTSLQLEIEQLKARLQRGEQRKEAERQTCVLHLGRVEDQLELLERNKTALEQAATVKQQNCYESLIEALKINNSSLILQVKDAEMCNETLKNELFRLKIDLQEAKKETHSLNSVKTEAASMLSEQESLEKRLFTLQNTANLRKSQTKDLIRQLSLKDVTIKDLQSSNSALQARIQLFQRLSHT